MNHEAVPGADAMHEHPPPLLDELDDSDGSVSGELEDVPALVDSGDSSSTDSDDEHRRTTSKRASAHAARLEESMPACVSVDMPTAVQRGCVLYALPDACAVYGCSTKAQHFQTMDCLALVPPAPPPPSPSQQPPRTAAPRRQQPHGHTAATSCGASSPRPSDPSCTAASVRTAAAATAAAASPGRLGAGGGGTPGGSAAITTTTAAAAAPANSDGGLWRPSDPSAAPPPPSPPPAPRNTPAGWGGVAATPYGGAEAVQVADVSPNGGLEVLVGGRRRLSIYRLPPASQPGQPPVEVCSCELDAHHYSTAVSPDGRFVAAGSERGYVFIFAYVREAAAAGGGGGGREAAAVVAGAPGLSAPATSAAKSPPFQPASLTPCATFCVPANHYWGMNNLVRFGSFGGATRLIVASQDRVVYLFNLPSWDGSAASLERSCPPTAFLSAGLPTWGAPGGGGGGGGVEAAAAAGQGPAAAGRRTAAEGEDREDAPPPPPQPPPPPGQPPLVPVLTLQQPQQQQVAAPLGRSMPGRLLPQREPTQQRPRRNGGTMASLRDALRRGCRTAAAAGAAATGTDDSHSSGAEDSGSDDAYDANDGGRGGSGSGEAGAGPSAAGENRMAEQQQPTLQQQQPQLQLRYPNAGALAFWRRQSSPPSAAQIHVSTELCLLVTPGRQRAPNPLSTAAILGFPSATNAAVPSPDGRWLAVGCDSPLIYLLPADTDYRTKRPELLLTPLPPSLAGRLAPGCQYLAFNADSDRLAASFDSLRAVLVYDVPRRQLLFSLRHPQWQPPLAVGFAPGHPSLLAYATDREYLVVIDVNQPRTTLTRITLKSAAHRAQQLQQPHPPPQQQQQQQQPLQPQPHPPPQQQQQPLQPLQPQQPHPLLGEGVQLREAAGSHGLALNLLSVPAAAGGPLRRWRGWASPPPPQLPPADRRPRINGMLFAPDARLLVATNDELFSFQLLLPNSPWSRDTHPHMPTGFKAAVRALLMSSASQDDDDGDDNGAAAAAVRQPPQPHDPSSTAATEAPTASASTTTSALPPTGARGDSAAAGDTGAPAAAAILRPPRPTGLWSLPGDTLEAIVLAAARDRLAWAKTDAAEVLAYPTLDLWEGRDRAVGRAQCGAAAGGDASSSLGRGVGASAWPGPLLDPACGEGNDDGGWGSDPWVAWHTQA